MPKTVFLPPANPSPNLQTLLAYIDAVHDWDADKVMSLYDETLEHQILPVSLGMPLRTKAEFAKYFRQQVMVMIKPKTFRVTLHEVVEHDNVIISHVTSTAESSGGLPFANEYIFIVHFVPHKEGEEGLPKICAVKEFVDSVAVLEWSKAVASQAAA